MSLSDKTIMGSLIPLGNPMGDESQIRDYYRDVYNDLTKRGIGASYIPPKMPEFRATEVDPVHMIAMRLRVRPGHTLPFSHLSAHVKEGIAVVFGVDKNNKPFMIEDDPDLFPSDTLITQLRLIIG